MSDRGTGRHPARITAVLGPTNTGKTHLALERMMAHASGMIGLPLRLLAREVFERVRSRMGTGSVALITGEEKIVPARAAYFVCTVEAMPLQREVEFMAIDEVQLASDPARGHVFTDRLLRARGTAETLLLGAATMAPLIRALIPEAEIVGRDRLSMLSYAGPAKLTRLPRRSAIVAFSSEQVYAIAELIRRQKGGAAVVMGSLSPRTRNAQVAMFQSGEVDYLVATDAIGMGLNMDVDHVAFAGLRKFDGRRTRWLAPQEVAQVAGRAGRHMRDGTFGTTGECPPMDEDMIEAVVEHRFDPVPVLEWRNASLDFDSVTALLRSLGQAPSREGLKLTAEALDEQVLRRLSGDEEAARRARSRGGVMRLWDVCQMPDFQKVSMDDHVDLVRAIFMTLTGAGGRLDDDFMQARLMGADRLDGEVDQLSARLARVRTLSYIAQRPDWVRDMRAWRERMAELETRLSDQLHERLTARFVDRRTSVLMAALNVPDEVLAELSDDGAVKVAGENIGALHGVQFSLEAGQSQVENRALRAAAHRAIAPEVARRLGELAASGDEAFSLNPDGQVLWRGAAAASVEPGSPFSPRARLLAHLGGAALIERAGRRVDAWLMTRSRELLAPLHGLRAAMEDGRLRGLARGIAWRLIEAGGVIARREVADQVSQLSVQERRALRRLGVSIGAESLHLPALKGTEARTLMTLLAGGQAVALVGAPGGPWRHEGAPLSDMALSAVACVQVHDWVVPLDGLERLAELIREHRHRPAEPRADQGEPGTQDIQGPGQSRPQLRPRAEVIAEVAPVASRELGWSEGDVRAIVQVMMQPRKAGRSKAGRSAPAPAPVNSLFAVLSGLKAAAKAPAPRRRTQRRHASRKARRGAPGE